VLKSPSNRRTGSWESKYQRSANIAMVSGGKYTLQSVNLRVQGVTVLQHLAMDPDGNVCCLTQRWQYHHSPCHQADGCTGMRYSLSERWYEQDGGMSIVNKLLLGHTS
jgi:hypothetical protein